MKYGFALAAVLLASVSLTATSVSAKNAGRVIDREADVRKDGNLSLERIEPGLTQAIRGNIKATQALDIAVIPLPNPLPPEWAEALAPDRARQIPITDASGKAQALPLQPVSFRALHVSRDNVGTVYTSILNQDGTSFFVLLSPGSGEALKEGSLFIITSNGRYALTSRGESIDLKNAGVKLSKGRLGNIFLEAHPSPVPEITTIDRKDEFGKLFFSELDNLFPEDVVIRGVQYSARPYTTEFLALYTPLNSFGDRYTSCGSLAVGSGGPIGLITSVAFSLPKVLSSNDCLTVKKPGKKRGK